MPDRVTSLDDPRLLPYRALKGSHVARRHGQFVVEGDKLVERLLDSSLEVISLLVSESLAAKYESAAIGDAAYLVADDELLSHIVGFDFHRGALACGRRPEACRPLDSNHDPATAIRSLAGGRVLVACPLIHDPENLGLIVRTAAGLGADGLLVSDRGADVFARRCLRVSMGAAFSLPIAQVNDVHAAMQSLKSEHGFQLVASTLADGAVDADAFQPAARFVLMIGSEPDGLPADIVDVADACIKLPMHRGIDSHNVAVATGMLLHRLMNSRSVQKAQ